MKKPRWKQIREQIDKELKELGIDMLPGFPKKELSVERKKCGDRWCRFECEDRVKCFSEKTLSRDEEKCRRLFPLNHDSPHLLRCIRIGEE